MGFAQTEKMNPSLPDPTRVQNAVTGFSGRTVSTQTQNEKALRSGDLLQGHKAVKIEHNGALYRLQATKLGKLILTK